jgi:hypothetical protein
LSSLNPSESLRNHLPPASLAYNVTRTFNCTRLDTPGCAVGGFVPIMAAALRIEDRRHAVTHHSKA